MADRKANLQSRIITFLGSRKFFIITIVFFVLEAAWIALSGRYPMAFDEDFHLGIIQLYAHHLSPFWAGQPAHADVFGAVARDPSYLYQYLMSFPYRFISIFTDSQVVLVLALRFISITLFAAALPLYRRLLFRTGASRSLAQCCLALFVLIPITPLLAAQINYDNLLLPLMAWSLLVTIDISDELSQTQRLNTKKVLGLTSLVLLTALVKYAFLPMLLAILIYLIVRCWQTYPTMHKFWLSLGFGFTLISRRLRWSLVVLVVLSVALFAQRYGVNVVRYHTPVPDCGQVLSVQRCDAYAPWARDYQNQQHRPANATKNPLTYTADWFYGMWLRTFFAVDGPSTDFQTRGPLVIPSMAAIAFTSIGFLAALGYSRRILQNNVRPVLWLLVGTMISYVGLLWLDGYHSFLQVGQATAINGRYLLPIMPLFLVICGLGWKQLIGDRQKVKLATVGLALLCMLCGGGTLTYILRSNNAWYWKNQLVRDANNDVRKVLGPITPGYRTPTAFMGHN